MRQRGSRPEAGFALLMIFVLAAGIAIGLMMQIPRVAFETSRNREEMLIERGEQYKRAIALYFRKTNRLPAKIEDLESTNNIRFLRRRYLDPMTGKDEWRIIHAGPGGVLTDSLVQKPPGLGDGKGKTQSGQNFGVNPGNTVGTGATPEAPTAVNAAVLHRPSDRTPGAGIVGVPYDPNQPQPFGQPAPGQQFPPLSGYPIVGNQPGQPGYGQPAAQPGQLGYQPGQPAYPQPGQPGYQPGQPAYPQPGQPGYQPGQPAYPQPGQPGYQPGQPAYPQPGQPGYQPGQPAYPQPGQPGYLPGQPAYPQPGQPGYQPGQPAYPQPGQPGYQQPGTYAPPTVLPGQPGYLQPGQPYNPMQNVPGVIGAQPGAVGQPGLPQYATNPGPPQQPGSFNNPGFNNGAGATGPGANSGALGMINDLLRNPRQAPPGMGGMAGNNIQGGIAGFASTYKGPSIKIYKERQKYEEWEFVYELKDDPYLKQRIPGGGAGLGNSRTGAPGAGTSGLGGLSGGTDRRPTGPRPLP